MRWIPLIVLIYLVVLAQTTVGRVLAFESARLGVVGPDLVAIVAVFLALQARGLADVALGAWGAGLALDLTAAGAVGSTTVVGPMSLAYVFAAAVVFKFREAVFREKAIPQALLAAAFCLLAHGLWVTLQTLLAGENASWELYGRRLLQAAALALYTAVLAPVILAALGKVRGWFVTAPEGRARRRRA